MWSVNAMGSKISMPAEVGNTHQEASGWILLRILSFLAQEVFRELNWRLSSSCPQFRCQAPTIYKLMILRQEMAGTFSSKEREHFLEFMFSR